MLKGIISVQTLTVTHPGDGTLCWSDGSRHPTGGNTHAVLAYVLIKTKNDSRRLVGYSLRSDTHVIAAAHVSGEADVLAKVTGNDYWELTHYIDTTLWHSPQKVMRTNTFFLCSVLQGYRPFEGSPQSGNGEYPPPTDEGNTTAMPVG
jgi:hypothetical protein